MTYPNSFEQTLISAAARLRTDVEAIKRFAQIKQLQRAEPWQQSIMDMCEKAVKEFDQKTLEEPS